MRLTAFKLTFLYNTAPISYQKTPNHTVKKFDPEQTMALIQQSKQVGQS